MTSTKEIEVTIKQHRKEKQKPLVVEFFFIIKGEAGRFAQRAGLVRRQLTPGLTSLLPGTAGLTR